VQAHRVGARVVGRDEQQLVGAGEGGGQRRRVGVVAVAHVDAPFGEPPGLGGVAHGDGDLGGRDLAQQVVDGGAVERAGGTGDDDHGYILAIAVIALIVSLVSQALTRHRYHR
jgi:hypothetical protein